MGRLTAIILEEVGYCQANCRQQRRHTIIRLTATIRRGASSPGRLPPSEEGVIARPASVVAQYVGYRQVDGNHP